MARLGRAYPATRIVSPSKGLIPILYGSTGAGVAALIFATSETHVIVGNALVVHVSTQIQNFPRPTMAVNCGGVAVPEQGTVLFYNDGNFRTWLTSFALLNPPTGTQTISLGVGGTAGAYTYMNSVSYSGVKSIGTFASNLGVSTSASLAASSGPGGIVSAAFAAQSTGSLTGFSPTLRTSNPGGSGTSVPTLIGDGNGAFSAIVPSAVQWGAVGVPLNIK